MKNKRSLPFKQNDLTYSQKKKVQNLRSITYNYPSISYSLILISVLISHVTTNNIILCPLSKQLITML